jgi:hypothetical protein
VQVAQAVVALAELRLQGEVPGAWLACWCRASQRLLSELDARQLSLCIWALAVLQHPPSEAWLRSWAAAMAQHGWRAEVAPAAESSGAGAGRQQQGSSFAVRAQPPPGAAAPGAEEAQAEAVRRIGFACSAFGWGLGAAASGE